MVLPVEGTFAYMPGRRITRREIAAAIPTGVKPWARSPTGGRLLASGAAPVLPEAFSIPIVALVVLFLLPLFPGIESVPQGRNGPSNGSAIIYAGCAPISM